MSPAAPVDPRGVSWELGALLGEVSLESLVGSGVDPGSVTTETGSYHFGSPATGGLVRVRGIRAGGEPWSAFVKVLQHVRHWPLLHLLPPQAVDEFQAMFPWREELQLWEPALQDRLPAGLRTPLLYGVADLGEDRLAMWMEDVAVDPAAWDLDTFTAAAGLLGAFNARMCDEDALAGALLPDLALRKWVEHGFGSGVASLGDDGSWAHPRLAGHGALRARMRAAVPLVSAVLERFAGLRHGMPHGDASPQNLLIEAGDPWSFVAIDLGFHTPAPLGFDLSQLVVGLAHAGELPAADLLGVEAAVLDAYLEGVRRTGFDIDADEVAATYAGTLLARSGFSSIPYEWLDDDSRAADLDNRLALTAFILDAADRYLR